MATWLSTHGIVAITDTKSSFIITAESGSALVKPGDPEQLTGWVYYTHPQPTHHKPKLKKSCYRLRLPDRTCSGSRNLPCQHAEVQARKSSAWSKLRGAHCWSTGCLQWERNCGLNPTGLREHGLQPPIPVNRDQSLIQSGIPLNILGFLSEGTVI